jgi:muconolactone D-isomerase
MEFLAEFDIQVPEGTPEAEVEQRVSAEAAATAELAREGHLMRVWRPPVARGEGKALGLYRADSEAQLDGLLRALPLNGWTGRCPDSADRQVIGAVRTHALDDRPEGAPGSGAGCPAA